MKISSLPLEGLLSKLRANFNANYATARATYNTPALVLEWPASVYASNTKTVIFGQLAPDLVDQIGVTGINRLVMYVISSSNQNYEKPNDFSGNVIVGLDFHLEWRSSDLKQNFETFSLSIEDAFGQTIQVLSAQNWGAGVVYNGQYTCVRSVIAKPPEGQGSLRQLLRFRLDFQVDE